MNEKTVKTSPGDNLVKRMTGALAPEAVEPVLADLTSLGFKTSAISVFKGEADAARIRELTEPTDARGSFKRFLFSLGADLELAQMAEQELASGHALITVEVDGEMTKQQVRKVLLQHGGHFIVYFGPWTTETMS